MAPKKKMIIKKPNFNKKKSTPLIWLIIISIILAILVPVLKQGQQFKDTEVWLNQLEKKFSEGKYSEIFINWNKAIATLSGQTIYENWLNKTLRDTVILPVNE